MLDFSYLKTAIVYTVLLVCIIGVSACNNPLPFFTTSDIDTVHQSGSADESLCETATGGVSPEIEGHDVLDTQTLEYSINMQDQDQDIRMIRTLIYYPSDTDELVLEDEDDLYMGDEQYAWFKWIGAIEGEYRVEIEIEDHCGNISDPWVFYAEVIDDSGKPAFCKISRSNNIDSFNKF